MKEIWKDINKHPQYQASSLGKIRRKSTGKINKTFFSKKGYEVLNLPEKSSKTGWNIFYIHRLIAVTFLCRKGSTQIVIHRNGKKEDNRACNLMYGTYEQVYRFYYKRNKKWSNSKLTANAVFDIKKRLCKGEKLEDIAERNNIVVATVRNIRRDHTWSYVPWPKMKRNFYKKPYLGRKGEENSVSKLANEDVLQIRKLLSQGVKGAVLAEQYKVDAAVISRIKHSKTWTHM